MKLVRPSYEILSDLNVNYLIQLIERAGRTCYKSEDKITTDSGRQFVKMILGKHHESVIEHGALTVKFIIDRGVSHELVRHRLASFSQESTRYCNYSKDKFDNQLTFIIPSWIDVLSEGEFKGTITVPSDDPVQIWLRAMHRAELDYNKLIEVGWQPQQARAILPNSLKTEIVVTANFREWRTIFKQRISAAAHPQMREIMIPLYNEVNSMMPEIFGDIQND